MSTLTRYHQSSPTFEEGVGISEGTLEGLVLGCLEGCLEGIVEGWPEGWPEGSEDGEALGWLDGCLEGCKEGKEVGKAVACSLGSRVGLRDGLWVGSSVGLCVFVWDSKRTVVGETLGCGVGRASPFARLNHNSKQKRRYKFISTCCRPPGECELYTRC